MLTNVILQDALTSIQNVTKTELCVVSPDGKVVVQTGDAVKVRKADVTAFVQSAEEIKDFDDVIFFKVFDESQLEYVLAVEKKGEESTTVGKLAALQIGSLLEAYKEHLDKDSFIKNLLLDNLLLVDIYNRAKKLHIQTDAKRVVYIAEAVGGKDFAILDDLKEHFADSKTDFITAVDEKSTIIIKDLGGKDDAVSLIATANAIKKAASKSGNADIRVAYGNAVNEIKEVSRSYKEARMALDVGKIFFEENEVIAYSQLGIGRLIYQLPIPLCRMFIKEIFDNKSLDDFDESTIQTINKFFENNLNVSETSRQLYIHRNTLVYRLDKLQKSTGLDLRVFEDAITFKIALMVVRYMKYMESAETY